MQFICNNEVSKYPITQLLHGTIEEYFKDMPFNTSPPSGYNLEWNKR